MRTRKLRQYINKTNVNIYLRGQKNPIFANVIKYNVYSIGINMIFNIEAVLPYIGGVSFFPREIARIERVS